MKNYVLDWKPLPFSLGERDWQAAVLRVVPARENVTLPQECKRHKYSCVTAHTLTITGL